MIEKGDDSCPFYFAVDAFRATKGEPLGDVLTGFLRSRPQRSLLLHPQPIPYRIPHRAHGGQRHLKASTAGKVQVRQIGEGVEPFRVSAQHFGNQLSGQVRAGDAMPAVALHIVNVLLQAAELRHPRPCQ